MMSICMDFSIFCLCLCEYICVYIDFCVCVCVCMHVWWDNILSIGAGEARVLNWYGVDGGFGVYGVNLVSV